MAYKPRHLMTPEQRAARRLASARHRASQSPEQHMRHLEQMKDWRARNPGYANRYKNRPYEWSKKPLVDINTQINLSREQLLLSLFEGAS